MSRRGGRGRRSRSPRSLPLFGRGFGGSRHTSSSNSGGSLVLFAILGWLFLVYLMVANRPEKVPSSVASSTAEAATSVQEPVNDDIKHLEIVPESWESHGYCRRGALTTSGLVGYGNMSIEMTGSTSMTYNFEITANGFRPTYLSLSFLKNEFPEPDRVSVFPYIVLEDGTELQVGQHQWDHHEWENRFLIFRTTSGETGMIFFGNDILMYGVGAADAKNFCSND